MSITTLLQRASIRRDQFPGSLSEHINLYLGNGRFGAGMDAYGFMHNGHGGAIHSLSPTCLMHADHWTDGQWGLDFHLPVARWVLAAPPSCPPQQYHQESLLDTGKAETRVAFPAWSYATGIAFDPQHRDVMGFRYAWQGASPDLRFEALTHVVTNAYHATFEGKVTCVDASSQHALLRLRIGTADTALLLRLSAEGDVAQLVPSEAGGTLKILAKEGEVFVHVGICAWKAHEALVAEVRRQPAGEGWFAQCARGWAKRWGEAYLEVPDAAAQTLWARSVSYALCSFAPDNHCPAPPNGWSGNGWNFHFPQDMSYIHPVFLRLGHTDVAQGIVEFYRKRLEDTRTHTARIYNAKGTMWAWEHPIGPCADLLNGCPQGTPNWYQYEIHNAAYPARMAYETACFSEDKTWIEEVAWPVIEGATTFYASVLKQGEDSRYGIHITPSMGQDEWGGPNLPDYLCALFSAQYCLETARRFCRQFDIRHPDTTRWKDILDKGIAFERLLNHTHGIYSTNGVASLDDRMGKMKHPVPFNPLTFLPLEKITAPVRRAYQQRHVLCRGVAQNEYDGWTLPAYMLAAARMQDAPGLYDSFRQLEPGQIADPEHIQLFESTASLFHAEEPLHSKCYYVTSHGLVVQALHDMVYSDYFPTQPPVLHAAVPEAWRGARLMHARYRR